MNSIDCAKKLDGFYGEYGKVGARVSATGIKSMLCSFREVYEEARNHLVSYILKS